MRHSAETPLLILLIVLVTGGAVGSCSSRSSPDEYAALDRLAAAAKPVMFTFDETPLAEVFQAVQQASGVDVQLNGVSHRKITIHTGRVSLKDALVQIARANDLAYEVIGKDQLIVHRRANDAS